MVKGILLVSFATEHHSVAGLEGPVGVLVAQLDRLNHESHREGSVAVEQVVLVPDVDPVNREVNSFEEIEH